MTKKSWFIVAALLATTVGAVTASAAYSVSPRIGEVAGGFGYTDWCIDFFTDNPAPLLAIFGVESPDLNWYGMRCSGGQSMGWHGLRHNSTLENDAVACPNTGGWYVDGLRGYYRARSNGSTIVTGLSLWCIKPSTWETRSASNFLGSSSGNDSFRSVRCNNNDVGWGITGTQDSSNSESAVRSLNLLCDLAPH